MSGEIGGSEVDHPQEPKLARTSILTYLALAMLAMNGAIEVADGISTGNHSEVFYGGTEVLIAVSAYFATPHRYRRA